MKLRRYRGMIFPRMADTYDDAKRVYLKKSIWMVQYLRARRSGDRLISFYRRKHFEEAKEARG